MYLLSLMFPLGFDTLNSPVWYRVLIEDSYDLTKYFPKIAGPQTIPSED